MRAGISRPCLCVVTDREVCGDVEALVERVAAAVRGGANMVQLRDKEASGRELLEMGLQLRNTIEGRALLFVNERVDVALACGADGVQLGEEALPVSAARRVAGEKLLIGRSVHSVEGAVEAEREGADLLVVGTIFATASHPGARPAGVSLLREVASRVRIPFIGIGGIDASNAAQVVGAGAVGVAVIRSVLAASDPEEAARNLRQALSSS